MRQSRPARPERRPAEQRPARRSPSPPSRRERFLPHYRSSRRPAHTIQRLRSTNTGHAIPKTFYDSWETSMSTRSWNGKNIQFGCQPVIDWISGKFRMSRHGDGYISVKNREIVFHNVSGKGRTVVPSETA